MVAEAWLLLPLWYAAFLLSITGHEAAHATAAYFGGDETAYEAGQVTLNPLPHLRREPVGTILVPLLSFLYLSWQGAGAHWMIGWASAPFDPVWEERHPRRAAWMALAGPLANLALAGLGYWILGFGLARGLWTLPVTDSIELDRLVQPVAGHESLEGLGRLASVVLSLNAVLFVFNLMPIPPLDGAAVLAGVFPPARAFRNWFRSNPMLGILGLLLAWQLFSPIFAGLYTPVLRSLYAP